MICKNCGKELQEGLKFCGYCGALLESEESKAAEEVTADAAAEAEKAAEEVKADAAAEAEKAAEEVKADAQAEVEKAAEEVKADAQAEVEKAVEAEIAPAPSYAESLAAFSDNDAPENDKPKKKKGKAVAICVALVLILCLGLGAAYVGLSKQMEDFRHRTFDKPKDYYAYLEQKNLEKIAETLQSEKANAIQERLMGGDVTVKETLEFKLGSRGKAFTGLASAVNVDLSWLESAGISYSTTVKKESLSVDFSPVLNSVKLLTGNIMMDLQNGTIYGTLPGLTDKYLGFSAGEEYDYEEIMKSVDKYKETIGKMMNAYPEPAELEQLALTYFALVLENIGEVKKKNATFEAGDVLQDCLVLYAEMDSEGLKKIYRAVLEKISEDEKVKDIFYKYYESLKDLTRFNVDEEYKKFQDGIKKDLESADSIKTDSFTIEVYVDKKGNIVGRTLSFGVDGKVSTIKYANLKNGKDVGFEFSAADQDTGFKVIGNGTEEKGNFSGKFDVQVDGKKMVNISVERYDLEAAKEGNFIGTIIVKPGKDADLSEALGKIGESIEDPTAAALIKALNPALKIDGEISFEKHTVEFMILDGNEDLIGISMDGEILEAGNVTFPADYISLEKDGDLNEDGLMDFVKSLDFDKVINALKEAKLPEEWTSMLEQYKSLLPMMMQQGLR